MFFFVAADLGKDFDSVDHYVYLKWDPFSPYLFLLTIEILPPAAKERD